MSNSPSKQRLLLDAYTEFALGMDLSTEHTAKSARRAPKLEQDSPGRSLGVTNLIQVASAPMGVPLLHFTVSLGLSGLAYGGGRQSALAAFGRGEGCYDKCGRLNAIWS